MFSRVLYVFRFWKILFSSVVVFIIRIFVFVVISCMDNICKIKDKWIIKDGGGVVMMVKVGIKFWL